MVPLLAISTPETATLFLSTPGGCYPGDVSHMNFAISAKGQKIPQLARKKSRQCVRLSFFVHLKICTQAVEKIIL